MKRMTTLLAALALSGCMGSAGDEEAAAIAEEIELDNGGLDLEDEAPLFGDPVAWTKADGLDVAWDVAEVVDAMEGDAELAAMRAAPEGVVYHVALVWGQLPPDREPERWRDWSGRIGVNRGGLLVNRTIRFEEPYDRLLPRRDRQVVAFDSHTRPHNDGLLVTIVDPTPGADVPLTLHYVSASGSEELALRVPIRALLDGPTELFADGEDRMVATAMIARPDLCAHGFILGRWHRVEEGRGRFAGAVLDAGGDPVGHLRGLYGVRRSGEQVFFGKYIDLEGRFRGLFGGHYGEGDFRGRWLTRAGEHGRLGGRYRESIPGPEVGGHFIGRWAETSCAAELPAPE